MSSLNGVSVKLPNNQVTFLEKFQYNNWKKNIPTLEQLKVISSIGLVIFTWGYCFRTRVNSHQKINDFSTNTFGANDTYDYEMKKYSVVKISTLFEYQDYFLNTTQCFYAALMTVVLVGISIAFFEKNETVANDRSQQGIQRILGPESHRIFVTFAARNEQIRNFQREISQGMGMIPERTTGPEVKVPDFHEIILPARIPTNEELLKLFNAKPFDLDQLLMMIKKSRVFGNSVQERTTSRNQLQEAFSADEDNFNNVKKELTTFSLNGLSLNKKKQQFLKSIFLFLGDYFESESPINKQKILEKLYNCLFEDVPRFPEIISSGSRERHFKGSKDHFLMWRLVFLSKQIYNNDFTPSNKPLKITDNSKNFTSILTEDLPEVQTQEIWVSRDNLTLVDKS